MLIDLQTEALFAHLAGKLALLFGRTAIALTEAEAKLSSGYIRCTKIFIAMYLLSNTLMLHVLMWFLFCCFFFVLLFCFKELMDLYIVIVVFYMSIQHC